MGVLEDSGWLLTQAGAEAGEVQMVCVHFVKTTTHPMMFVTFFKFPSLISCFPLHILCAKFTLVQRQNVAHTVNFAHFLSKVCTIARMNVAHVTICCNIALSFRHFTAVLYCKGPDSSGQ
jgi:hypothetical protein